jgi:DNA helicase II / ATP-dependent DNA helicase PcrA
MAFRLSAQQEAIVHAVAANDSDLQVVARAGCGKTTTILAACGVAKGSVGFFAFNKAIATELQQKAPSNVMVQTLHSLGFAMLRGSFRGVQVDNDKTFNLVKGRLEAHEWDLIAPVKRLVGLVKNNLREPTAENLDSMADEYGVDCGGMEERIYGVVRAVISASVPALDARQITIDFDDMIWLPAFLGLKSGPQLDWVFVDEAQDLNAAQMELIRMISTRGRVCFVGDPAQAIYAFRGADSNAMAALADSIKAMGRTVATFPLTQTRRCPKAIVKAANEFVPDFEALPDAPEGVIQTASLAAVPGDMVVCRLNAPLIAPAYALLRAGVPVKVQGRDIGAGLTALVKRLKATSIDDLFSRLDSFQAKEQIALGRKYGAKPSKLEAAILALNDKVETIRELAAGQTSVAGLLEAITRLFGEVASANGVVLLSTIHRAKGLEAPRVWILETPPMRGPQEGNLRYVAITRAKESLFLVPMPE